MRSVLALIAFTGIMLMLACESKPARIASVQVNPEDAQADSPGGHASFVAVGIFDNQQSRNLTMADRISWSTYDKTIASIDSMTGLSTCNSPGATSVTVHVSGDVPFRVSDEPRGSSTQVVGMANLLCRPTP